MRLVAGLAMVVACGSASAASAQALSSPKSIDTILDRERFADGVATERRSGQIQLSAPKPGADHVDSVRLGVAGAWLAPGGLAINRDRAEFQPDSYDVTLIRSWPRAVSFETKDFDVDLSPHAGVGVSNLGGQAEAGAMLTVGQKREKQALSALSDMGVKDGLQFGDKGRWYLFAAASGRAVGLNMLRGEGGWDRAGWSTDPTGALVGDAQVGVGWRKGDVQTSFGVIHREVKGQHMVFGQHTREDTVAAFSFSIRPQR